MNNWKDDLAIGKTVEAQELIKIQKLFPDAHGIEGYCKEYDIFIPSANFGIEVKSDQQSQRTGNLVVEIEMPPDNPSALSTTKAKYWIFWTGKKSIMVLVSELRKLVKDYNTVVFTGKGDNTPKRAYLMKQYIIERIAINFENGALDTFI